MGINLAWIEILQTFYGTNAFLPVLPNIPINVLIEDGTLTIRSTIYAVDHFLHLKKRIETNIKNNLLQYPNVKQYTILFDEKEYVPLAKQIEQNDRSQTTKNLEPLSKETIDKIRKSFSSTIISNNFLTDELRTEGYITESELKIEDDKWTTRIFKNKEFYSEFYAFVTKSYIESDINENVTMNLDGGLCSLLLTNKTIDIEDKRKEDKQKKNKLGFEMGCFINKTNSKIIINDSTKIGESDLKLINTINQCTNKENILILSYDSDFIIITLLNLKIWIEKSGNIERQIYLKTKTNFIHINQLWRNIIEKYFSIVDRFVYNQIEVFSVIILLAGCDYVEQSPYITPKAIHNRLNSTKWEYLLPDKVNDLSTVLIENKERIEILLHEKNIISFYYYLYKSQILKCEKKDSIDKIELLFEELKKNSLSAKYKIKTVDELFVKIRNIRWTICYWLNGWKPIGFKNEFKKNENGLSYEGFIIEDGIVKRPKKVARIL